MDPILPIRSSAWNLIGRILVHDVPTGRLWSKHMALSARVRCDFCGTKMTLIRAVPARSLGQEFQHYECTKCHHTTTLVRAFERPNPAADQDARQTAR